MKAEIAGKRIAGVLTVLPSNTRLYDDEISDYRSAPEQYTELKAVMGFHSRRVMRTNACASDLAIEGVEYLLSQGHISRDRIGAVLYVSQTPDAPMPATSNILHGRLGLDHSVFCLDVNQGCAGYIVGCALAFSLLDFMADKDVLLINGDTLSRRCSTKDRNIYPMVGDAAAVTVLRSEPTASPLKLSVYMDGSRAQALQIPAGGIRLPYSQVTSQLIDVGDGNYRALEHFAMDGSEVFRFVMKEVPGLIEEILCDSSIDRADIEYFFLHQPNRFILSKLIQKANLPPARTFSNIVEQFGNASSVTIPTNICFNGGRTLVAGKHLSLLAGFGVGLTWAALVGEIGDFDFCEIIEIDL